MIIVIVFKVLIVVLVPCLFAFTSALFVYCLYIYIYINICITEYFPSFRCSLQLLQYLSGDSKRGRKDTDEEKSKKGYYKETFITSQTLKVLPLEPKSIKKNERLYVKEANGKLKRK